MSPERFKHLFSLVGRLITKQDTHYGKCIHARRCLVITLRYLAEGCSQQALSMQFLVGKSTASKILKYLYNALYTALSPIYLIPTSSEEDWKQIRKEFLELWNTSHVVGAIDARTLTHCTTINPNSGRLFWTCKRQCGGYFSRVTKTPVIHCELKQISPYSSHLLYRSLLTFLFHSWEPSLMASSFILMTSSPIS